MIREKEDRVIIYVDDLILTSKNIEKFVNVKSERIKSTFKMIDLGPINNILGINVQQDDATGNIHISQKRNF